MQPNDNEQSVGELTGEYLADKPANEARPAEPESGYVGEVTGEFTPDATDERVPGARTRAAEESVAEVGGGTVDFNRVAEPGPEATGEFVVEEQEKSVKHLTGLRSVANLTAPASLGAFPAPEPSMRSGRYFLKNFHAKGGMGEVWMAIDGDIGRPVALKRMLKGKENAREQFIKEAQVTGQLEHPGVVPVHELGVDEHGQPYYVMKFIQGKTLGEAVKAYHASAGPKDLEQHCLLTVFVNLCQTVAYAHSRGVIHRDIKPDNVMVGAYGETLVLDWGLAKVIGSPEESSDPFAQIKLSSMDDTLATMDGSIKGTPAYFAPEMAEGIVENVDQLSDVYLLGSVLYSILTGRPPRQAKKMKELLDMARTKRPDPPRQINATVSKPIDAICMKALAHDKKERYASATALAEEVQRYLAGEPVTAYRETFSERAWRWVAKHRTAISRTAAAVLVLGTVLTAFFVVRDFKHTAAEAKREADRLQNEEQARQEIAAFRNLAEEARFYAAIADPTTDHAPFVDLAKVQAKGKEALAVAEAWGPEFQELALEDQRPRLKDELYDLLVELAQATTLKTGAEPAREGLALLDRARSLRTPTQSYYRLRALCMQRLDQGDKGEADSKRAKDEQTPTTALDHFLVADQLRREAGRSAPKAGDQKSPDANKSVQLDSVLLDQAMAQYRNALALDPDHYWSYFQLGYGCYMVLGRNAEAVEALGACVALQPKAAFGYSVRAQALAGLKRFKDAHADLDQAIQLDPQFFLARFFRGVIFFEEKKYDQAVAELSAVLDAPDKRMVSAAFARGQAYMFQKEDDKALADFNLAIENKLQLRNVHQWRARVLLKQGKGEQALEDIAAFLTNGQSVALKDPVLLERQAHELRGLAGELPFDDVANRVTAYRLMVRQLDKAIKHGAKSAALHGERGWALEKLAELLPKERSALVDQAIASYSQGLQLAPKDAKLRNKRGWARVSSEKYEEAREDFRVAVDANRNGTFDRVHADARVGLGFTQACLRESTQALQNANWALLHDAGDYVLLHNVACIYATLADQEPAQRRKYQDMAIDLLQRTVELWIEGGRTSPNAIRNIRGESSFRSLENRPEFLKLKEMK